jgi:predicted DNA-binding transcriptional regulator AlpA
MSRSLFAAGTFRLVGSVRGVLLAVTPGVTQREIRALLAQRNPVKKVSRGQVTRTWVPIREAAALLKVSRSQVYALISAGKLKAIAFEWPVSKTKLKFLTAKSVESYGLSRYVNPHSSAKQS